MPCLLGHPESSPCAGISAPANCLNLIYARKPFDAVRIEGANEQHEVVDDDGGGGPPCPAPPPGSKFRLLPCLLPLSAVDPRFEGWLASRWYPPSQLHRAGRHIGGVRRSDPSFEVRRFPSDQLRYSK